MAANVSRNIRNPTLFATSQREDKVCDAIGRHLKLMGYHSSITDLKVLYFLFCQLDPDAAKLTFRDCWPAHDKKQEAEFRRLCKIWLQNIADNEPSSMIPKQVGPILMNLNSRKFQQLLCSMCRHVMSNTISCNGGVGMQDLVGVTPANYKIHVAELKIEIAENLQQFKEVLAEINRCSEAQKYAEALVRNYNKLTNSTDALNRQAFELSKEHNSLKEYYDAWMKARASDDADAMRLLTAEAVVQSNVRLSKIRQIFKTINNLPNSQSPGIGALISKNDNIATVVVDPVAVKNAAESIREMQLNLNTVHLDILKPARKFTETYAKDAQDFKKAIETVNVKLEVEEIPDCRLSIQKLRSLRVAPEPYMMVIPPSPISSENGEVARLEMLHHSPVTGGTQTFLKPGGGVSRCGMKTSGTLKRIPSPLLKDPIAKGFQSEYDVEVTSVGDKQWTLRKLSTDKPLLPKYLCGSAAPSTSTPLLSMMQNKVPSLAKVKQEYPARNIIKTEQVTAKKRDFSVRPKEMKKPDLSAKPKERKTHTMEFLPTENLHHSSRFLCQHYNKYSTAADEVVNEVLGPGYSPVPMHLPFASPKSSSPLMLLPKESQLEDVDLTEVMRLLDSPFKSPKKFRRRSRSVELMTLKTVGSLTLCPTSAVRDKVDIASADDNLYPPLSSSMSEIPQILVQHDADDWLIDQEEIYCETDSVLLPSSPLLNETIK